MPIVSAKNVKVGVKLLEDVYTSLGGMLFAKGTVIGEREKEILKAFLIDQVAVEEQLEKADEGQESSPASSEQKGERIVSVPKESFSQLYEKSASSFKQIMLNIRAGQPIPVMQVREAIHPLLQYVQVQPDLLSTLRRLAGLTSYTYEHAIATGVISYMIARWLNVPENEWMQVALAGTLSDVGLLKIDQRILLKTGRLTQEEFEEIKKHTIYGYQLIKAAPGLNQGVAKAALEHHERQDGSGYPIGLSGNQIHLYSKIVAVADTFHAMTSDRVFQSGMSPYLVIEHLLRDSFGKLDPTVVRTFVNGLTQLAVGTVVELNDGQLAKIVFVEQTNPTRPMLEIGGTIINLRNRSDLFIVKIV
ncbi:HD-GYP domain-containing protein [Brevibacillus fulvus]|uniref:HD-GYP domain-containing protein (C-di-GMP phosphodiesterase class II) n=1 Tax=Brevibacillus fulvus TaxID=1125967 RepID=A0A938Y288_9BACL|nr:HD-GYP domain-containing protein [Brevibacillus fulvus]MBM7591838.1 HD-GYP domain-containing protein (c-di-GMP phosphodiesterase class II) [Brevibacillus fulvus]